METLNSNFLEELFKTALKSSSVLETVISYVKYEYLPSQEYKKVLKTISNLYELEKTKPTIGNISQKLNDDQDSLDLLKRIKKADANTNEILFNQLEDYIKRSMFVDLYGRLGEYWNTGKQEEAIKILQDEGKQINDFSIKDKEFEPIFNNWEKRYTQRENKRESGANIYEKCSFGIDSLDERTNGGIDAGDIAEMVLPSGMGKTKYLRYAAQKNARLGKTVLHIQAEGTKQEVRDGYDAMIAGASMTDIEMASLEKDVVNKIRKSLKNIRGEIYIYAFEQFGQANMADLRQIIMDFIKSYGDIDMLIVDYIDKFEPASGKKYPVSGDGEKARRQAIADDFKNIAVEFNLSGITATQTSDIPPSKFNDPNFVITRSYIKGDKNQIEPFSYVFTGNQTTDEYQNGTMRIYEEKIRKYKAGAIHYIAQSYNTERFYDPKKTRQIFVNNYEKAV